MARGSGSVAQQIRIEGASLIDLTDLNTKTARTIRAEIRRNLTVKRAANGETVPPNMPRTIKRKGFDHRNIHTRKLYDGILREVGKHHFAVSVSQEAHSRGRTIEEIGQFNQKSHPKANKSHKERGLLVDWFGISERTRDSIVKEYEREMFDQLDKNIKISGVVRGRIK